MQQDANTVKETQRETEENLGSKHLTVQLKAEAIASSNVKSKLMLETAKQTASSLTTVWHGA